MMKREGLLACLITIFMTCLFAFPAFADDSSETAIDPGFIVHSAETHVAGDIILLDASFGLQFSKKLFDALHNGITLNLTIEMRVFKERNYVWDAKVTEAEQHYQISYSSLTGHYTLTDLNREIQFRFPRFGSLLAVVSVLSDFPLLDHQLLKTGVDYRGAVRISVNRDSLPVPLRLMSYVTSGWHFVSEWYSWPLPQ